MQVKNKLFPYPILNHDKVYSNYGECDFILNFEAEETEESLILKDLSFSTDSELLNNLYDENKIKVYLVVECSYTVFRQKYEITKVPQSFILRKVDFTDRVDVSMFAVAQESFSINSEDFGEDYAGIDFEIERYDIVAANDGFSTHFNHDEKESTLVKSIFSINTKENFEDDLFAVDCQPGVKKINITLSDKEYKNYKIIYSAELYKEVFFNMLLVPALIQALSICKTHAQDGVIVDMDDLSNDYPWLRTIIKQYKVLTSEELTLDVFKNQSAITLAQKLLGKPLGKALNNMVENTNSIGGDIDE